MSGARRGFLMAVLEQYAGLIFNFVTVIAVSRFLGPAETGAGVVGLSIAAIVFSLREFASPEFLIRLETIEDRDILTSMTFLMLVTLLLSSGLYLARDYFALTYHDASLLLFLDITILAAIVESLSLPVVALLRREMAFGMLARIRTAGSGFGALITIAMAWLGFGHMCFAFGLLASALTTTGLALTIYPLRRLLKPSLHSINTAMRFGIYLGGNAGLNKICETFPQLMLGRFMPIASVGIYNRANTVSGLPDRIFLSAVFTVAFPMLSAHARAGGDISRAYIRALSYISVVYWPAQILLALLAYPAVEIILGPGWSEAALIVAITSLASLFWFPVILTYPLLMALGANREAFISNLIARSVATAILCLAAFHGLLAVALSQFISLPFQMIIAIVYVRKHVAFSYRVLVIALLRSASVTLFALAGPFAMVAANGFGVEMAFTKALLIGLLAVAGWLVALLVTRHPFSDELRAVFRPVVIHLKARFGRVAPAWSKLSEPAE
jgi:O-antigen/teichoic acid export membrane protein